MNKLILRKIFKPLFSFLKKTADILLLPLREERTMMLFCFLMSCAILIASKNVGEHHDVFLSLLLPVIDFYLVCVAICLLNRLRIGWLLALLVAVVMFAEFFTVLFYHSCYSPYVMLLVMQTDSQESSEFITSVLTQPSLWISIGSTTGIIALSWLLAQLSRRRFIIKPALSYLALATVVWSGISQYENYEKLYNVFSYSNIADCEEWENKPDQETTFCRMLFGLAFNLAMDRELDSVEQSVENITVDSCSYRSPLIVLIIGESYNKHHAQLYNKDYLPTTPRMCELREKGNLFAFTDAVTSYNLTSFAFRSIFSTSSSDEEDHWERFTLFPAVFKKAGYKVHFISNQFLADTQTVVDLTGGAIFNRPKLAEAQLDSRNEERRDFDLEIMEEFPPMDSLTGSPTLLIVHLKGQHMEYKERYPKEFDLFKAEQFQVRYGGEQGRQMVAEYANATLYNDYVVDSICSLFKQQNAIAIYLADHGEEIYDWRDMFIRSNETDVPEVAHYQYEIPFIIYMSDVYKAQHETIVKEVEDAVDRPLISSDICHILFHLAGISCKEYRDSLNVLSPDYNMHTKRILRNTTDYDELMRSYSDKKQ